LKTPSLLLLFVPTHFLSCLWFTRRTSQCSNCGRGQTYELEIMFSSFISSVWVKKNYALIAIPIQMRNPIMQELSASPEFCKTVKIRMLWWWSSLSVLVLRLACCRCKFYHQRLLMTDRYREFWSHERCWVQARQSHCHCPCYSHCGLGPSGIWVPWGMLSMSLCHLWESELSASSS
jgi:hypothetical protein